MTAKDLWGASESVNAYCDKCAGALRAGDGLMVAMRAGRVNHAGCGGTFRAVGDITPEKARGCATKHERPEQSPKVQVQLDALEATGAHINTRGCAPMAAETVEALVEIVKSARTTALPSGQDHG